MLFTKENEVVGGYRQKVSRHIDRKFLVVKKRRKCPFKDGHLLIIIPFPWIPRPRP